MKRMQDEVDSEEDLIEVFRVLDQDGDGLITKADLREVVVRWVD
jgi:Ca2+-binding EF-hand superfamily protein